MMTDMKYQQEINIGSQAECTDTQIQISEGRHKYKERSQAITKTVDNKVFVVILKRH